VSPHTPSPEASPSLKPQWIRCRTNRQSPSDAPTQPSPARAGEGAHLRCGNASIRGLVLLQSFPRYDHIDACAAALPLPLAGEGWGGGVAAYAVAKGFRFRSLSGRGAGQGGSPRVVPRPSPPQERERERTSGAVTSAASIGKFRPSPGGPRCGGWHAARWTRCEFGSQWLCWRGHSMSGPRIANDG